MFETLLIVDDMDMEREMFKELLQDHFTILEAENGKECLEIVESCRNHIDIIILDIMMPEMNGFEVLEYRQRVDYFKEIPVVIMTVSGAVHDQVKAFQLGANDYICKPIIPDIVLTRINNVLESKRRFMSILQASEEFKVKAEIDQMTSLYNKVTAEKMMDDVLQIHGSEMHALMILDIDNFKTVNDTEGHQVGDHTIRIIADLISSHFRKADIVGRIGGDEFAVLMTDVPSKEIARQKARDVVRIMKYKPNLTIPANVSLSVGIAFNEAKICTYNELFSKADQALYCSKREGRARVTEYGVKEDIVTKDNRDAVILLGRVRNNCSIIEAALAKEQKLLDAMTAEEAVMQMKNHTGHLDMMVVDVSEDGVHTEAIWNEVKGIPEIEKMPVVAVCREGSLGQLQNALSCGIVKEILTAPLDAEQVKRCIARQCKK